MILSRTELDELIALDEGEMVDTCLITKPGDGEPVLNEETLQYDEPDRVTVYQGKCQFLGLTPGGSSTAEVAEQDLTLSAIRVKLPLVGSGEVARNQQVEVTASLLDPDSVGRKLRVTSHPRLKTVATSRQVVLEEGGL